MSRITSRSLAAVLVFCAALPGADQKAAGKKGAPKEAQPAPKPVDLVWPSAPEVPRVRWLAEYSDMAKVKSPGARKSSWMEKITGTKAPDEKQELAKPYGIATDRRGRIYAADTQLGVVYVIDAASKAVEMRAGNARIPLAMPVGVALDANDLLFVSDAELHSIVCFSAFGQPMSRFGNEQLQRPGGIALDRSRNRLYVADAKASRIAVFDTRSQKLIGYYGGSGNTGPGNPNFSGPSNVALDRQGRVYVADTLNCRVQILDPDGKFVRAFGSQGDGPGAFIRPKGIAVDSEGHVYVADAEFNNFQIFTAEGQPLLAVGSLGQEPGHFALLAGLHIDAEDRIYTTEMYNGRVQVFQYISQAQPRPEKGVSQGVNR